MIGTLRSCPQKLFRTYIEHWKGKGDSIHLVAGKAFASGVEGARRAFYEDGVEHPDDALAAGLLALTREYPPTWEDGPDDIKTFERMAGALEFYFEHYPLGRDRATPIRYGGRSGVEFSFAHPLPVTHPTTGDPILYTGRADMVADAFGGRFVFDEKTTGRLGPSWLKQWDLRSQFTGYCWALREYGIRANGVVVRGVSILANDYGTAQVITYRSDYEVELWLRQVCRDIERAKLMWAEGYWDYNLDHACTEYSGCALQRVCKSPEPERWLPMQFEKKVWDPLARSEVSLEEWNARWAKEKIHATT